MILRRVQRLRARGVLGINGRNASYVLMENPRRLYPLVDNKLRTKEIAARAGIVVPETYVVISSHGQLRQLPETLQSFPSFVVKPARGFGGNGILIIPEQVEGMYRRTDGFLLPREGLLDHISGILSGLFSLEALEDEVLIEAFVHVDTTFDAVTYLGVPDIRIIVYRGVPVMAMVRLPTRESGGKANLHQGAIGAGIDLATGKTLAGVRRNRLITCHPDTHQRLEGIAVPHWDQILHIAVKGYEITGLGYLGVDVVLDRDRGPLLLELNARPGLGIQLANGVGLESRLRKIAETAGSHMTAIERVRLGQAVAAEHPL